MHARLIPAIPQWPEQHWELLLQRCPKLKHEAASAAVGIAIDAMTGIAISAPEPIRRTRSRRDKRFHSDVEGMSFLSRPLPISSLNASSRVSAFRLPGGSFVRLSTMSCTLFLPLQSFHTDDMLGFKQCAWFLPPLKIRSSASS